MKTEKKLGIYLDHATAKYIDLSVDEVHHETLDSNSNHSEKVAMLHKNEKGMHNKEQQELGTFFNTIAKKILNYNSVLLFGPTDAKVEFFNYLRSDHKYDTIKIAVRNADKMNEKEEQVFVKHFFETVLDFK